MCRTLKCVYQYIMLNRGFGCVLCYILPVVHNPNLVVDVLDIEVGEVLSL